MTNPLIERIEREASGASLFEALANRIAATDLQSLLLEVFRLRAGRQTPADMLQAYEKNVYVRPSPVNPQTLVEFDRVAFGLAVPTFEPVELSPVCPLGTNSVVAPVDQNKAIATIRNTELVSDSTNVLTLECAVRRRARLRSKGTQSERIRLCSSHRLLRPQRFSGSASFAHFRLFALCTAGRDEGSYRFECEALAEHIAFYLRLFTELTGKGYAFDGVRVAITDLTGGTRHDALHAGVVAPLVAQFPVTSFDFEPYRSSARNYYTGLCFNIYAKDHSGIEYQLVDGGITNWTQQLLSNQKERLFISGVGTERVCMVFIPEQASMASSLHA